MARGPAVLSHVATAALTALIVVMYYEGREAGGSGELGQRALVVAAAGLRGAPEDEGGAPDAAGAGQPLGAPVSENAPSLVGEEDGQDDEPPRDEPPPPLSHSASPSAPPVSHSASPPAPAAVHAPGARDDFLEAAPPQPACLNRRSQAAWFTAQMAIGGSRPSACASGEWIRMLRDRDFARVVAGGASVHRVVLDVGANKGYVLAEMLGLWQPWRHFNPQFIKAVLDDIPGSAAWEIHKCGVCQDCLEVLPQPDAAALARQAGLPSADEATARLRSGVQLSLYAVEPQPSNVGLLRAVQGAFNATRSDPARFALGDAATVLRVFHMGFAERDYMGRFEERGPGDEGSSLGNENRGSGPLVDVPVARADTFVPAQLVASEGPGADLSIMFIDTEGYDPGVIDGAAAVGPHFRIIAFEYGSVGLWATRKLEGVVEQLDGMGFTCYLEWGSALLPLTQCWHPGYETKAWINVMCVNRRAASWAGDFARHAAAGPPGAVGWLAVDS